ncbi:APC family permease [Sphingomonas sp. BN140010]|uniref:APC family permease n=1 Tax=Sphingomonas arvum TaxID=2992113 RepID=A0ABT3JDT1_9SPHN|nr:APC family permease [Sphingomonas sp. BN140010]MCW3797226.1 APC family permease [Sphingomonas sp. BN140010]
MAPIPDRNAGDRSNGGLLRVLGLSFALAVGVGSVIGGGILRTPSAVVDSVGSVQIALLLWAAVAVHAAIQANVIAELITSMPKAGGFLVPARAAFGEPGGLLIGWVDWLNLVAGIAALSIITAEFLGLLVPQIGSLPGLAGALIALLFYGLNWLGVREGSRAQIVGSLGKFSFLVAVAGLIFLSPPPDTQRAAATVAQPITLLGIVVAYQMIFGAYSGWPNAIYFAEEDTDPGRNIPRALFGTIAAVALLYLLVSAALSYALPLETLRSSKLPAADAIGSLFGSRALQIVAAGAVLIAGTCLNANIMSAPRVLYGLAEQRLFPRAALAVNRGGTPSVALMLTALGSVALTLTGEFETVFRIMAALGMFPLLLADVALFKLRRDAPDLPRPYRARLYPLLPAISLALDATLLVAFLVSDWTSGLFILGAVALAWPIGMWMRRSQGAAAA